MWSNQLICHITQLTLMVCYTATAHFVTFLNKLSLGTWKLELPGVTVFSCAMFVMHSCLLSVRVTVFTLFVYAIGAKVIANWMSSSRILPFHLDISNTLIKQRGLQLICNAVHQQKLQIQVYNDQQQQSKQDRLQLELLQLKKLTKQQQKTKRAVAV